MNECTLMQERAIPLMLTSRILLAAVMFFNLQFPAATVLAQGTAFAYQGNLSHNGQTASGLYDFQFAVFEASTGGSALAGGPLAKPAVGVANGHFTVTLDFGAGVFSGPDRWLEVGVRTNGSAEAFTTLSPRQPITPVPYALHAANAGALMSFMNAPLEIKVNGVRALRLEPTPSAPNLIGGSAANRVGTGVTGAAITGGDQNTDHADFSAIGGGFANSIAADSSFSIVAGGEDNKIANAAYSVIGGGSGNDVSANAPNSTIAGGVDNRANAENGAIAGGSFHVIAVGSGSGAVGGGLANAIRSDSPICVIAGGLNNSIGPSAAYSFIGGGSYHRIAENSPRSVIGGGENNSIHAESSHGTISGGRFNALGGDADHSTISGGKNNQAAARRPLSAAAN
jgi:hypothetical protein